jgi:hypothetical protein
MIESEIRSKVKYEILRVLEIICQNQFGFVPDDLNINFKPLRIMSEQQEEEIKNQKFQRLSLAAQSGFITVKEAKQSINKENLLPIKIQEDDELEKSFADSGLESTSMPEIKLDMRSKAKSNSSCCPRNSGNKGIAGKIKALLNGIFKEDEHSRDSDGQFAESGGGSGASGGQDLIKQKRAELKAKAISVLAKVKPIAQIKGNEFEGKTLKEKRDNAKIYFEENLLNKSFYNKDFGENITISNGDKSFSESGYEYKINSIKHLPAILENSSYLGFEKDTENRPNVKGWHYLSAKLDTQQGTRMIILSVREDD